MTEISYSDIRDSFRAPSSSSHAVCKLFATDYCGSPFVVVVWAFAVDRGALRCLHLLSSSSSTCPLSADVVPTRLPSAAPPDVALLVHASVASRAARACLFISSSISSVLAAVFVFTTIVPSSKLPAPHQASPSARRTVLARLWHRSFATNRPAIIISSPSSAPHLINSIIPSNIIPSYIHHTI